MRLKNSCVAVFAVFTLFIAGCSNNLVGRVAGDGKGESTVTFSVTDIPANYAEMIRQAQNSATRSILPPTAPFTPTTPGLTFVLTGTSNSGKAIEETVTLSSTAPYTFKTTLGAYVWDLTLTAYKGPAANKLKVMEGHSTIDLTLGNAKPTFNMSIKGLTTPGTVKINGTVTDTDNICTHYEIGIYNLYSGKLIDKYTDVNDASQASNSNFTQDQTPSGGSFTFTYGAAPAVTLNAGAYEYRMIFYKGSGPKWIPIGSYSDTIVVYPGYDLVHSIQPNPLDVLNKKPTKPEELRAYLVKDSEDKDPDYYYVQLTWKPSQFETNYELMLKTSSDDGTTFPANGTIYGFKATNNNAEDFLASAIRHDGNLAYGSTTCTLKLQLGKVYEVNLRAHNYIGDSDWVERVNTVSPTPPTPTTDYELIDTGALKHINRRRIKYDLNGGTLILDAASPTTANTFTGTYIKYDSYTGTAQPLLDIKPSTTTPLTGVSTLTRSNTLPTDPKLEWTQWLNPNNGQTVPFAVPTSPTGIYQHENVFVKADFGFGLEGTVTPLPAPTDLPKDKIKITYDKESGTTHTAIGEDPVGSKHYPVPKKVGGEDTWITVEFDGLSSSSPEYDDLHCTAYFASGAGLLSKVDLQAVNNVCKFSTGDYTPQTFTLKVMARETATNQMRSQTYIIDLH